ncbi:hypothetical protein R6Q57_026843 [Mikania cordata]
MLIKTFFMPMTTVDKTSKVPVHCGWNSYTQKEHTQARGIEKIRYEATKEDDPCGIIAGVAATSEGENFSDCSHQHVGVGSMRRPDTCGDRGRGHRRTFGTIRDPNVPEKAVSQKPKAKPSNQISLLKQPKTDPEFVPAPKAESVKTSPQNGTNDTTKKKKKKVVSFQENNVGYVTEKSPAREGDGVKTPVRPPFSVKAARIPGTPYLSAEKCSCCRFDRLETSSYWLVQIKSAEAVGKHFVSAAFFRLAHDCKAESLKFD